MNEEVVKVYECYDIHIVSYVVTLAYPDIALFFCVSTRWCDDRNNLAHDTYETRVFTADASEFATAHRNYGQVERKGRAAYSTPLGDPSRADKQHCLICNMLSQGELKLEIE